MSLKELKRQRLTVEETFKKADAAVHAKKISQAERDALMQHYFDTTHMHIALAEIDAGIAKLGDADGAFFAHQSATLIAGFFVVIVSLFAVLWVSTGGITGAVVAEEGFASQESFTFPDVTSPGKVYIDLDPEGTLGDATFSTSHYPGNTETITEDVLSISGPAGSYVYVVYMHSSGGTRSSNAFLVTFAD